MPATVAHVFIAYALQLPVRRRLDLTALLIAAVLPDIESVWYAAQALQVCTTPQCVADWPSHSLLHSVLGLFIVIAPLATAAALWLRDRGLHKWRAGWQWFYLSALVGGGLHFLPDLTVARVPGDQLQLLWPSAQPFAASFLGAELLWDFVALLGAAVFIWKEGPYMAKLLRPAR